MGGAPPPAVPDVVWRQARPLHLLYPLWKHPLVLPPSRSFCLHLPGDSGAVGATEEEAQLHQDVTAWVATLVGWPVHQGKKDEDKPAQALPLRGVLFERHYSPPHVDPSPSRGAGSSPFGGDHGGVGGVASSPRVLGRGSPGCCPTAAPVWLPYGPWSPSTTGRSDWEVTTTEGGRSAPRW